jgi:putative oxidoreductase
MSMGLLVLRVAFGALFAAHGTQKLFGWFGGYGLEGTGGFFESIGFRPGKVMAFVAGATELSAGLGLAFGLLTPLAAAAVIGVMINAIFTPSRRRRSPSRGPVVTRSTTSPAGRSVAGRTASAP